MVSKRTTQAVASNSLRSRELCVVVLTDSRTDRVAAQEAIASGRQERFMWIEASHLKSSKHREVLVHLCQRLPQLQNLQAIDLDGLFLDR